jgi:hypothetical protein
MNMTNASPSKPFFGTLRAWATYNPRKMGQLRLVLFAAGLMLVGMLGARWANPAPPEIYNAAEQCTYAASRYNPPAVALYAVVGQPFQINWTIQNTGSCHIWNDDILFARHNDDMSSQAYAYPAPSQPLLLTSDNPTPEIVAYVTTVMTAPPTSGVYVTEWAMRTPDGRRFGPIMQQRVQVVDVNAIVPAPISNEPPFSPSLAMLSSLISLGYHMLPALLGIMFVLWRANGFLNRAFGLPNHLDSLPHVTAMMFGTQSAMLSVSQGKLEPDVSTRASQIIGGPAWLTIAEGNAALLEHGAGFSRIVGTGIHLLRPHERVRGVVDLRPQQRRVKKKTLTADGISIILDIDLIFQISEGFIEGDALQPPIPPPLGPIDSLRRQLGLAIPDYVTGSVPLTRFSREAVRRVVYETAITNLDWTQTFASNCAEGLANQLLKVRLDQLIAFRDSDHFSLNPISEEVSKIAQQTAASAGIDLLDITSRVYQSSPTSVADNLRKSPESVVKGINSARSGGADLNADEINIGGDVVGRDKIVQIFYSHITYRDAGPMKAEEKRAQATEDDGG